MTSLVKSGFRKIELTRVMQGPAASACRYALAPLTRGVDVEVSDDSKVRAASLGLINTWRARLLVLQQAGWESIREPEQLSRLGNCPPAGVAETKGGTFSCRKYRICPFCWCRQYVLEVFARIYAISSRFEATRQPFDLVEVRTERKYPIKSYLLAAPLDWIKHCKSGYYREYMPDAYGGFVLCTIEPPDYSARDRNYRLLQRVLALVPKRAPTPPVELARMDSDELQQESRKVRRTSNPALAAITAAVGRTCIYPKQLMQGNAKETVDILDAQAMTWKSESEGRARKQFPVRTSEFYGVLRQRRAPTIPEDGMP